MSKKKRTSLSSTKKPYSYYGKKSEFYADSEDGIFHRYMSRGPRPLLSTKRAKQIDREPASTDRNKALQPAKHETVEQYI
jgi:hypothetical protein